ncbi:hypothetical protein A2U01_0070748, partial [Trifolium medium]|nr:hypothetical protein [Trifolium medium]
QALKLSASGTFSEVLMVQASEALQPLKLSTL